MNYKRRISGRLLGLVTAGLALGLMPFSNVAKAADEMVLGLTMAFSGIYATMNKTTEVAVDIAVAEINAAGGINGKKLRVVKFDTASDPKQAVAAVRNFREMIKPLVLLDRSRRAKRVLHLQQESARVSSKFPTHLQRQSSQINSHMLIALPRASSSSLTG